jgi:hypothetical protein
MPLEHYRNEDRYLLVMVAKADGLPSASSNRWIAALAAAVAVGATFYLETRFFGLGSHLESEATLRAMIWALVVSPLGAYCLVRILFAKK